MTARRPLKKNLKPETEAARRAARPRRVIFCWNYLEWGGAQMYFLGIAARIKNEVDVLFVFPRATDRQFIEFCEQFGIAYELLDGHGDTQAAPTLKRKFERHRNKIRGEIELLRYFRKFDFRDTILHIELAPWQSVYALEKLCRRATVFITMHNRLPRAAGWRKAVWKAKFRAVTRHHNFHLFTSNRDAKESLAPYVAPSFLDRVEVTYTNVNPDEIEAALAAEFDRGAALARFDLPPDKFLVLAVGQFIDRKGRWTLLEAARLLAAQDEEIYFGWVSNSVLSAEDEARVAGCALGDRFRLIRSDAVGAEHLELMKFLRLADCFTLPSFQEGLPISLLEAMALGVPSVSTRVNAIPEAIIDGETGLLVEAGDAASLAEAILRIKNETEASRRMAAAGRAHVLASFNEKTVAEIALAAYRKAFVAAK